METFNQNLNELVKATWAEQQHIKTETTNETNDKNIHEMDESAKSQDFFQDNNAIGKTYTTTCTESRSFLSNIAYVGINKEYYYNRNLIFDVYFLLTKNLNPFSLDRKLADETKHEMIHMLWKECMPIKFYRHICKEKTFWI